ncbi:MAG: SufD family Fe-S cluster assembly protein [Candidatus Omnitrophota bacterium]
MRRRKTQNSPSAEKIDIKAYETKSAPWAYVERLERVEARQKKTMLAAGVDLSEKERCGTYLQMDHSIVHTSSHYPGLEVMGINEALQRYEWLDNYFWRLIALNTDEWTREAGAQAGQGYFIRALPGAKAVYPLQACLFINKNNVAQNVHNIIIAEEGSELQVITGCTVASQVRRGMHIGISEIFVKKGAKLTFTMVHNWAEDVVVRPRTAVLVEERGIFLSNYVCLKPVKTVQMYPRAELIGRGAVARYNSLLFAPAGAHLDIGARVILKAAGAKAEVTSRAVSAGGDIIARGHLRGEAQPVKAHLECRGLMITEKGFIHAIPELEAAAQGAELSHEAAVGKIAQEEIEYLMARGISQNEAQAMIVRGFLDTSIMGLPLALQKEIEETINACEKEVL